MLLVKVLHFLWCLWVIGKPARFFAINAICHMILPMDLLTELTCGKFAPTTHHPWSCANLQVSCFQPIPPKRSIFFLLPPPPFPCGSAVTNIFQVVLDRLSIKKTHTLWKPQNHPTQHGCLNILSISFFLSNQQFSTKREAWSITKNTKKRMKHKPFQPCHSVRSRLWGQGWETQPTMMLVRRFGGVCVLEHSPEW